MKHSIFKYFICLLSVLFIGCVIVSCDDSNDYVYENRTVHYVNCNSAVNLRETPSKNGKIIRALRKDTRLEKVEYVNSEWCKVETQSGETGYMHKKYVDTKSVNERVRRKNDIDDLRDKGQIITLKLLDFFEDRDEQREGNSVFFVLICVILTFVGIATIWPYDDIYIPVWIPYLISLVNGVMLLYLIFFLGFPDVDIHWLISIIILVVFLLGVVSLWCTPMFITVRMLGCSSNALLHTKGTIICILISTVCGYWIESLTDVAVVVTIIWNIVFLFLYMIDAIKKNRFASFLAILLLWAVCIIPAIVLTVFALKILFLIACLFFVLFALAQPSGRSSGGGSSEYYIDGSRVISESGDERETYDGRKWRRGNSWDEWDEI